MAPSFQFAMAGFFSSPHIPMKTKPKTFQLTTNGRGFPTLKFKDDYGADCTLQMSSIWLEDDNGKVGGSAVWLGVDEPNPQVMSKILHPDDPTVTGWEPCVLTPPPGVKIEDVLFTTRMHLNREQVRGLVKHLQQWLKTSTFVGQET